ncbi:helix-turn-helix transcriptional regulator [Nocardioides sp. YIM 152588]|uniref:helix-turn-helix domain-containing protein n=1 Tax=Nocardioides sp. YIM 152588 TaxID=3158259 RepID=UPI0032E421DF
MVKGKVGQAVGSLGEYLKEQRLASRLSLRQLSELAGVSNPYLSQIERGLRKPSAEVLGQLAKALRISAGQLYVRAGIISLDEAPAGAVEVAILSDGGLTERQKQSLLDVYASFLALNAAETPAATTDAGGSDAPAPPDELADRISDLVATDPTENPTEG